MMSSGCWTELCSENHAGGTGQEGQPEKEKQETEVPCRGYRSAESQRREEPKADRLSPDCDEGQEVTSEGGPNRAHREGTVTQKKRGGFSCLSVKQKEHDGVPGTRIIKHHLQKSKPKSHLDEGGEKQPEEPVRPRLFYYFGGTNGVEIVKNYCESRGWRRMFDNRRQDFILKWCETKSASIYSNFREGEQLMFQNPINSVLTSKIGLLSSLRDYERVNSKTKFGSGSRRLKLDDFIPTTFRMDVREEREHFFSLFAQQEGENKGRMWISKPTNQNQGKGISLLQTQEDAKAFRLKMHRLEEIHAYRRMHHRQEPGYIVQQYIQNPLLLNGRKFDVRSYLLIACSAPFMVFFHHGYVRLTCDAYDLRSRDLSTHLTNQYVQKQNPLYSQLKEDTVWSMERFNAYVNDRFQVTKSLPRDWVLGAFAMRMQQIMAQCFFAAKSKLSSRLGFFDLLGCDFLIDEDFKVWLLELNCNPALHTHCEVLQEVIPSTVVETLDLSLEIFNKCRLGQKILPLTSQRDFVLLYNGVLAPGSAQTGSKNSTSERRLKTANKIHQAEPRTFKLGSKGVGVGETRNNNTSKVRPSLSLNSESAGKSLHSSKISMKTASQVKLRIKQNHLKAANDVKRPKTQQKTRTTAKLSALDDRSSYYSSPGTPSKQT